jgi:8-oxo-dGTP diphosphatase
MQEIIDAPVIEAAGGVVQRETPEGLFVAVIYRERYGPEWALPKGKRQPGETWQQTALREVEEETGLRPTIIGLAGATTYLAGSAPKLVLYWKMRVDDQPTQFIPNEEVRELEWLPLPRAADRLTHPEEQLVLRMMLEKSVLR